MHIGIVGAGAGGIITAIMIKLNNPSVDVTILEKSDKIGKKLCATGNGRCNLANNVINSDSYNIDVSRCINEKSIEEVKKFFFSLGLPIKSIDNLCYPYSESAGDFVRSLKEILDRLGVEVKLNETLKEYEIDSKIMAKTNNNQYIFDSLVISTGGKSSPSLGSDGSLFNVLKNHGYKITSLRPGLCPIKTKEKTSKLNGLRIKASVSLYEDDSLIAKEDGTVLFKKDGLSGIVIFNMASRIARRNKKANYKIALDLFKDHNKDQLTHLFEDLNNKKLTSNFLEGLFVREVANDILLRAGKSTNITKLVNVCKNYEFTYLESYDFSDSQVTIGGVSNEEVNISFESKKETNVYMIGEILDVDGLSGGYNLMWAFISGLETAKAICDIK